MGDKNEKSNQKQKHSSPRFRRLIRYALIGLVVLVVLTVTIVAGMEYHTGQSEFCGSCHVMGPYYDSWETDVHGSKDVAACVDCHYRPGDRHTVKAKLKGLSQLMSYVSGRTGSARLRPRVQDDSCLRSGCHSRETLAGKETPIKDVKFGHGQHIQIDDSAMTENAEKLSHLEDRLNTILSESSFGQLHQLAIQVGDRQRNEHVIHEFAKSASADPAVADLALEYARAVHRDIRLKQLGNLRCTTCHANNEDKQHFSVRRQICYTCHFMNEKFNTGTGRCLNCHEPPQVEVQVHGAKLKMATGQSTRAAGMMDHAVIIANNVNCLSCHADLIAGTGKVTRQRCASCHDQAEDYEVFDTNLNTESVARLHATHTSSLHASCTDCHDEIEHRLVSEEESLAKGKGSFLRPVLDNCAHCHPDHHRGQAELLMGKAPSPVPHGVANAMFGSRVNCLGCHTGSAKDLKGADVIEATKQACIACHSDDYEKLFDEWLMRLEASVKDTKSLEKKATQMLAGLSEAESEKRKSASEAMVTGRAALAFVESAQGIHNRNYALELLDYAAEQFDQAIAIIRNETPASSGEK